MQTVHVGPHGIVFAGTVNFSRKPVVVPSKTGFPPKVAQPGGMGDADYTPLVTTGNGAVIDAPQVADLNNSVVSIDYAAKTVTLKLLDGFVDGVHNYYVRTDGSIPLLAAIESSTYAPNLNAAPQIGSDVPAVSARSAIVPVINGPLASAGANERQGLDSALLGRGPPENIEQDVPDSAGYSPLWDVTPVVWTAKAIAMADHVGRVRGGVGEEGWRSDQRGDGSAQRDDRRQGSRGGLQLLDRLDRLIPAPGRRRPWGEPDADARAPGANLGARAREPAAASGTVSAGAGRPSGHDPGHADASRTARYGRRRAISARSGASPSVRRFARRRLA